MQEYVLTNVKLKRSLIHRDARGNGRFRVMTIRILARADPPESFAGPPDPGGLPAAGVFLLGDSGETGNYFGGRILLVRIGLGILA